MFPTWLVLGVVALLLGIATAVPLVYLKDMPSRKLFLGISFPIACLLYAMSLFAIIGRGLQNVRGDATSLKFKVVPKEAPYALPAELLKLHNALVMLHSEKESMRTYTEHTSRFYSEARSSFLESQQMSEGSPTSPGD